MKRSPIVAGRLRELLYGRRISAFAPATPPPSVSQLSTQERILDAAIASSVVIDEPTDLVTMVRLTGSGGLKAILKLDRTHSPSSEDVQSKKFELDFPLHSSGTLLPAALEFVLKSPGFEPHVQKKKIRIPAVNDSDISVFMLTPKRAGILRLNLRALSAGVEVGSRALVTTSLSAAAAPPLSSYGVSSLPLQVIPDREPAFDSQPASLGVATTLQADVFKLSRELGITSDFARKSVSTKKRSRFRIPIGIASTAAAIALATTVWTTGGHQPDPGQLSLPSLAPPLQSDRTGSRAPASSPRTREENQLRYLEIDKRLAEAQRAAQTARHDLTAHLNYAQLLEEAHLDRQALSEYQKVQSLHPPLRIRALAKQRAAALNLRLSSAPRSEAPIQSAR